MHVNTDHTETTGKPSAVENDDEALELQSVPENLGVEGETDTGPDEVEEIIVVVPEVKSVAKKKTNNGGAQQKPELSEKQQELVTEIAEFLETHACVVGNEGLDTEDVTYVSQHAQDLHKAMIAIGRGQKVSRYFESDWDSGAYFPYGSQEARAWHDDLMGRVCSQK